MNATGSTSPTAALIIAGVLAAACVALVFLNATPRPDPRHYLLSFGEHWHVDHGHYWRWSIYRRPCLSDGPFALTEHRGLVLVATGTATSRAKAVTTGTSTRDGLERDRNAKAATIAAAFGIPRSIIDGPPAPRLERYHLDRWVEGERP